MKVEKEKLLDTYLPQAYNLYLQCTQYKSCLRRFETIDGILAGFISSNPLTAPNKHIEFYEYFSKQHEKEMNKLKNQIKPRHKDFSSDSGLADMPISFYYILWMFKLYKELNENQAEFEARELMQQGQFSAEEENFMKSFAEKYLKLKLLLGLFFKTDVSQILTLFVSSFDANLPEYTNEGLKEVSGAADVKMRLFKAIKDGKKFEAAKMIGLMYAYQSELTGGEYEYLEAMTRQRDGDYEGAIQCLKKVTPECVDYAAAIALKLECYADSGNTNEFLNCLDKDFMGQDGCQIDYFYLCYLVALLYLNAPVNDPLFDEDSEENKLLTVLIFEDDCEAQEDEVNKTSDEQDEQPIDWTAVSQARRLSAKCVEELFLICEQEELSLSLYSDYVPTTKDAQRKKALRSALSFLVPQEIVALLDDVIQNTNNKQQAEKDVVDYIRESLIDKMSRIDDQTDWLNVSAAFMFLYRLNRMDNFVQSVIINLPFFKAHLDYPNAIEILQLAYLEAQNSNTQDEELTNFVDATCPIAEETAKNSKIMSKLSPHGKKAYEFALWQFKKCCEDNDYGWKDAGLISLAFFRILEVEINERIINKLVDAVNINHLRNTFNTHRGTIQPANARDRYFSNWNTNITLLEQAKNNDPRYHGFELGKLHYLFKMLTDPNAASDPVAVEINSYMNGICDIVAADLVNVTNHTNRQKFRNPPAHTKYLPYSEAVACKEMVEPALIKIYENLIP